MIDVATGGLVVIFVLGLLMALRLGGRTFIQHFALRMVLCHEDRLPWMYARFLDHAAERILLHPVCGGYEFFHGRASGLLCLTPPC